MQATATVTVSIGRGLPDGGSMRLGEWDAFRQDVRDRLALVSAEVYVDAARSVGEWEGVPEESATWVALIPADNITALRGAIRAMAVRYRQDAIALTVGTTELVRG